MECLHLLLGVINPNICCQLVQMIVTVFLMFLSLLWVQQRPFKQSGMEIAYYR